VFLVTAIAKLISACGTAAVLEIPDPILDISFRHLLWIIGISELIVALFCIFGNRTSFPTWLVAWFATSFLVYRITFILAGYKKPCPCLGNITDMLHISPKTADTAMKIILAYLLIGSYATLFCWWQRNKDVPRTVAAESS
jgi:hypothetical protein